VENQHRQIKGYRELSKEEIDLMNRIKEKGEELGALCNELVARLNTDQDVKTAAAQASKLAPNDEGSDECVELRRFKAAEPLRWANIGKTKVQIGIMALIRAVAQPTTF
jgi:hypothetical protein